MADHIGDTARKYCKKCLLELVGLLCDENVKLEDLTKKEAEPDLPRLGCGHDLTKEEDKPVSPRRPFTGTWIRTSRTRPITSTRMRALRTRMDTLRVTIKNPKRRSSASKKIAKGKDIVAGHVMVPGHRSVGPAPPEMIKNRILEVGGSLESMLFLIQKRLYEADVKPGQSRLSVPCRKVMNKFLESNEAEVLESEGKFPTILIQPSLEECHLSFAYWPSNATYVLHAGWNLVLTSPQNGLEEKTIVQLWSFRIDSRLCFALVKMD